MALTKYKFGDFIVQRKEKYDELEDLPIRGVSREGFIKPKQEDVDTSVYNIFYKNDFVFNPARMELNSIALNTYYDKAICSSLYEVFYVARKDIVLPEYLNMYIKRDEFARKCWFEAIGSARNYFRVSALSEFEIELPDLPTQQKYVDIYNAMVANQQSYERGLDDLKLVCDGYIEDLRRKMPCEKIAPYIVEENNRNSDLQTVNVQGVNSSSSFGGTRADTNGLDFRNYKIVQHNQFAYNPSRINLGSIALYKNKEDCIISPMYCVFSVKNEKELLPEYLMLWFGRKEFQRSTLFYAMGSVRDTFDFSLMMEVEIPIPDISVQQSIVDIYRVYTIRKKINEQLKAQIKNICPILIRGSLEEA